MPIHIASTGISRRNFIKAGIVAGISVYVAAPGNAALAALLERELLRPPAQASSHRWRTKFSARSLRSSTSWDS